ncbi:DUF6207 family protein [Streptomyces sp. NPDC005859]|uniref:DUF6207 family protein n=1 Tax=Streptomyces sp. NPDC005859 TaxID=3157170 RepID=UPI0034102D5A
MRCGRWATSKADRTTRDPGQPGVRLRCSWTCARSSAHSPPARAPGEVARCCSALTCHGRAGGPGRTRTRFADRRAGWKAWGCDVDTAGTDAHRPCVRPCCAAGLGGRAEVVDGVSFCPLSTAGMVQGPPG